MEEQKITGTGSKSELIEMLGTWQPIETYDKLKKKPEFAVFYVQPKEGNRPYTGLPRMIVTERRYGSRVVSHWMPLPAPPERT